MDFRKEIKKMERKMHWMTRLVGVAVIGITLLAVHQLVDFIRLLNYVLTAPKGTDLDGASWLVALCGTIVVYLTYSVYSTARGYKQLKALQKDFDEMKEDF